MPDPAAAGGFRLLRDSEAAILREKLAMGGGGFEIKHTPCKHYAPPPFVPPQSLAEFLMHQGSVEAWCEI